MFAAIVAIGAGKGRDGGAGINYEGLTLGWVAYPEVDVVSAVALVEGGELLVG